MILPGYGEASSTRPPSSPLGPFLLSTLDQPGKAFESVVGNAQAPIVIVVYGSFSCSACADFHTKCLDPLLTKYTHQICFLLKDYPTDGPSTHAVLLTWCVPEKADILRKDFYSQQEKWVNESDFKKALMEIAQARGLTARQCEACFNKEKLVSLAAYRAKEKEATKLTHVPLIFLVRRSRDNTPPQLQEVQDTTLRGIDLLIQEALTLSQK